MTAQNSNPLQVAVIGLGNIGQVVATNLVNHNRSVIVADRSTEKANTLAEKLGQHAQPMTIGDAIKAADIVVLAIWFNAIKEVLEQYSSLFKGKIVIDLNFTGVEKFKNGRAYAEFTDKKSNKESKGFIDKKGKFVFYINTD